jgi:hypothetical protein
MSRLYLASSALDALDKAQAELQRHLLTDAGGRSQAGGELEPCDRRNALTTTILGYGRLPQRQPGRTKAGLRQKVIPAA